MTSELQTPGHNPLQRQRRASQPTIVTPTLKERAMTTTLIFPADQVRKLVDHAFSSEFHKPTMIQRRDFYGPQAGNQQPGEHIKTPPGLWLVKDFGVYLMSNGHPGMWMEKEHRYYAVYASGYDPNTDPDWFDRSHMEMGGSAFCQSIEWDWDLLLSPDVQQLYITVDEEQLTLATAPPDNSA